MSFAERLRKRLPVSYRLGTLQTIGALVVLGAVIAVMVVSWKSLDRQMGEARSDYYFQTHALHRLDAELKQWKQFDRIISALQFLSNKKMKEDDLVQTARLLYGISQSTGVDPLLVLAVVSVESRGNPWAVGRFRSGAESGAMGLMQIKFETARIVARGMGQRVRSEELLRPDVNLLYGTAYLLQMIQRYNSLEKGLIAYNIGPGALEKAMSERRHLPKRYYNRVLSNYNGLMKRFGSDPIANAYRAREKPSVVAD